MFPDFFRMGTFIDSTHRLFYTGISNCRRYLNIQYVIAIHLMR